MYALLELLAALLALLAGVGAQLAPAALALPPVAARPSGVAALAQPAPVREICVAHWVWDDKGLPAWRSPHPAATVGSLDLRTLPQQAWSGPTPWGWGVFVFDQAGLCTPGPDVLVSLGGDLDKVVDPAAAEVLSLELFTEPGRLTAPDVRGLLWELVTEDTDPRGLAAAKPVLATRNSPAILHLGGFGIVKQEPLNAGHLARGVAVFQDDYRRKKTEGGDTTALQKWTGDTALRLYGEMTDAKVRELLPPEFVGDGAQKPATPITDDFETDSSANWTADGGTFTIDLLNSGYLEPLTTEMVARYSAATLASANHYVKAVIDQVGAGTWQGPAARKAASSTLTYYAVLKQGTGTTAVQMYRRVAGSYTQIGTDYADMFDVGAAYEVRADGSSVSFYRDGSFISPSVTDSNITGNTAFALISNTSTTDFESVEADVLGGAASRRTIRAR